MRENITHVIEDYLKAIYELSLAHSRATTNQIAARMDVAPASATGMIQRLAAHEPPLVDYQKHRGVVLTPAGERAALEIIRHHRLLELFLQHSLGYTWDEVHAEADRLEHVISEQLEERIAKVLGDPVVDPHGEPIPNRDLHLPSREGLRLCDVPPGQRVKVERMGDTDAELLRYLASIGLVPGTVVKVLDISAFDDNLRLSISGQAEPLVLGLRVTRQIYVELAKDL